MPPKLPLSLLSNPVLPLSRLAFAVEMGRDFHNGTVIRTVPTPVGFLAGITILTTNNIGMGLLLLTLSNHGMGHLLLNIGKARMASLGAPHQVYWAQALSATLVLPQSTVMLTVHIAMMARSPFPLLRALRWFLIRIPTFGFTTPVLPTT